MRLSLKEKAAYGLGAVGKDMVYMLSASYVLYYYQDLKGIDPVIMGIILMAARIFDAFNDPIMGVLVAKTKTKWGRFRPWMLVGTLINAVILYFMFAVPPALDGAGLVAYAAIIYIVWGVTYTMMDIPYWSMIPAFTEGGREREGLTTLARSCAGVGSALITVITVKCVALLGHEVEGAGIAVNRVHELEGFRLFALLLAIVFVVFITVTCLTVKEKSTVDVDSPSVKEMFRALVQNDQAMAVVVFIVLINGSLYVTSNLLIYFFKYDLAGAAWKDDYTLFNTFGGAIQILSMMILFPLLRRFLSTTKIYYVSMCMAIGGYTVLLVLMCVGVPGVAFLFIPAFFIFGAFGMLTVLTTIFLANTVDYGELKNNRRDESVIFSMQTFVVKLASGVAALIASVCLELFQISSDEEAAVSVAGSSVMGLRMFMTLIPIAGMVAAVVVFYKKYILSEEKVAEIGEKLRGRM